MPVTWLNYRVRIGQWFCVRLSLVSQRRALGYIRWGIISSKLWMKIDLWKECGPLPWPVEFQCSDMRITVHSACQRIILLSIQSRPDLTWSDLDSTCRSVGLIENAFFKSTIVLWPPSDKVFITTIWIIITIRNEEDTSLACFLFFFSNSHFNL